MGDETLAADRERVVAGLVEGHYDFIWRLVRRVGVIEAEDAVQQVFFTASRKLGDILPGRERAFLTGVALRVAADCRRTVARRRESSNELPELESTVPGAEQLVDRRRARAILDQILERLTPDLRQVFVLYELEDLDSREIAALLDIPPGTVASRLRRAREAFEEHVRQWQAAHGGEK
jgi:RNA polymerase sigma-70 factor (ECF subfamily)